jgi:hypothetical protein
MSSIRAPSENQGMDTVAAPENLPASDPSTTPSRIGVLALLGGTLAMALLGVAGWFLWDTHSFIADAGPNEDQSLAGLGYLVAAAVAVPGVLTGLLSGVGYALRLRARRVATGLAVAGLALGGLSVLVLTWLAV